MSPATNRVANAHPRWPTRHCGRSPGAAGGAPGFGVTLAPDLERRFPYVEGHYAVTVEL